MEGTADEMENLLAQLRFVLQFLHSEGFESAKGALLAEIEQRLPSLIQEKLTEGAGGGDGPLSPMTDPGVQEAFLESITLSSPTDDRRSRSAEIFSRLDSAGAGPSFAAAGPFLGSGEEPPAGPIKYAEWEEEEEVEENKDGQVASAAASGPPLPEEAHLAAGQCRGQEQKQEDQQREEMEAAAQREYRRSPSLTIPQADEPPLNEYSDDDDLGYIRIDIRDQYNFLHTEIDPSEGGDASPRSTPSHGGSAGSTPSRSNGEGQGGAASSAGAQLADSSRAGSVTSGSSGASSRHSSFFSGELSDDRSAAVSTLASVSDASELGPGFGFQAEVDEARMKIASFWPLPPADSDQEVFVFGTDSSPTEEAVPAKEDRAAPRLRGGGSEDGVASHAVLEGGHSEASSEQVELDFQASPSEPTSPPVEVDFLQPPRPISLQPKTNFSSPGGKTNFSSPGGRSSGDFDAEPSDVTLGMEGGLLPRNESVGVDFAFPVTPTAQDPAALFSTWTHIRSRSLSNASDYFPEGFSPSQQSPERGGHADAKCSTMPPRVSSKSNLSMDSAREGDTAKQLNLDDFTEAQDAAAAAAAAVAVEDLPPDDDSPLAAIHRNPSLSLVEQPSLSLRQSESGSAQQVISMLEELENARTAAGAQLGGSHGGSLGSRGLMGGSHGSPAAGSPISSAQDLTTPWNEEDEGAAARSDSTRSDPRSRSAGSGPDLEASYPDGGLMPDGDFEGLSSGGSPPAEVDGEAVREYGEEEEGELRTGKGREPSKAEDVVMQYDPLKVESMYEVFNLQIIHRRHHTGFEETKDFPICINDCVAGRYQILEFLGSAAFSRAVQALDLKTGMLVCLKIIKNNKDYFDQSLDEIKLLQYVNDSDPLDSNGVLRMYDYFYYKEHLFIVCELLRANLYEFQKYNRESGDEPYFTLPRLQAISRQVLQSLAFLHSLGLIHSDLKPENILIKSYSRCEVKVIDLGSSCFTTDHLSNYVQSRSYRAPEVILGHTYDQRIDIWSLGCILAELASGYVLFQNDSLATLLARLIGILGPIPKAMLTGGRYAHRFFTRSGHPYERSPVTGKFQLLKPKVTSLAARVPQTDSGFLEFLSCLLAVDPSTRPTAEQALQHPWLQHEYPPPPEQSG
mmetsp:Transcript_5784/g.16245  ORF Transcript_5784/g.16245 Transcript_5784/m.16245 type:complete len:1133 (+) Transcript_5784:186-3584(+)